MKVVLTLLLLLLVGTQAEIQRIELPLVSPKTQNQVTFQINYLKMLLPTYNWLFCNRAMLYRVAVRASEVLHQAAQEMKLGRGNAVDGRGNQVAGFGNVVIGSDNRLVGLSNWCFTSGYETEAGRMDEGVLALGNYKVELSKVRLILRDPKLAICLIDDSELQAMKESNVAVSFFFK